MIEEKVFLECDRCGEQKVCAGRISEFEMPEGWAKIIDATGYSKYLCPICAKRFRAEAEKFNKEMGFKVIKC